MIRIKKQRQSAPNDHKVRDYELREQLKTKITPNPTWFEASESCLALAEHSPFNFSHVGYAQHLEQGLNPEQTSEMRYAWLIRSARMKFLHSDLSLTQHRFIFFGTIISSKVDDIQSIVKGTKELFLDFVSERICWANLLDVLVGKYPSCIMKRKSIEAMLQQSRYSMLVVKICAFSQTW